MNSKSPAAILHQLAVKEGTLPKYEFVSQTGPPHLSIFEVECTLFGLTESGKASSKKVAKQQCAQALLRRMVRTGHEVPAQLLIDLPTAPVPTAEDDGDMMETRKFKGKSVKAREAAEDRARGEKRKGCDFVNQVPQKINTSVKSGQYDNMGASGSTSATSSKTALATAGCSKDVAENKVTAPNTNFDYLVELSNVRCVARGFIADHMFHTKFGKLVLLIRFWQPKLQNMQSSCYNCGLDFENEHDAITNIYTIKIEKKIVAQAYGDSKLSGREAVANAAFEVLINEAMTIFLKERFTPQGAPNSFHEIQGFQPGPRQAAVGAPVDDAVSRMMIQMGWQGGGIGADDQDIAEPGRSEFEIIHRSDLGFNMHQVEAGAEAMVASYAESDRIDDLVFHSDFNGDERKAIHHAAQKARLKSKSYGIAGGRFIVVSKTIDPFQLAQAVARKGGNTPKYKIFIPAKAASFYKEIE